MSEESDEESCIMRAHNN